MISYFRKKRLRKRILRMIAGLRRELAIGFSSKPYYAQGQITNTFRKTNHETALLPLAVASFSDPNEVDTILKEIEPEKTTKEIYEFIEYAFGIQKEHRTGTDTPYANNISSFYESSILPSLNRRPPNLSGSPGSSFYPGGDGASDSGDAD